MASDPFVNAELTMRNLAEILHPTVDAVSLLRQDHQKVRKQFKQAAYSDPGSDSVQRVCLELVVHSMIEEEIFYPVLRARSQHAQELLDEAQVEHAIAKRLIDELADMETGDPLYAAKFKVLGEYVNHHIDREEAEIFPLAKKAGVDLAALGRKLSERKRKLQADLGMEPDDEQKELACQSEKFPQRH